MAQGVANLSQALSTGGRATGGPQGPKVYNGKAEALPKDFAATGTKAVDG
jgi:hypothetical protein